MVRIEGALSPVFPVPPIPWMTRQLVKPSSPLPRSSSSTSCNCTGRLNSESLLKWLIAAGTAASASALELVRERDDSKSWDQPARSISVVTMASRSYPRLRNGCANARCQGLQTGGETRGRRCSAAYQALVPIE